MSLSFAALFRTQMVILDYRLRSKPKTKPGVILELKGRPSGFFHSILNALGMSTVTDLSVTCSDVRQHTQNLFGNTTEIIPLRHIDSVGSGFSKPIHFLVLAVFAVTVGATLAANRTVGMFGVIGGLVVALLFLIMFLMGKSYFISFGSGSGNIAMRFKSGSGKGLVGLRELQSAIQVVREMLMDADQPGGSRLHAKVAAEEEEEEVEEEYDDDDDDQPLPPKRR